MQPNSATNDLTPKFPLFRTCEDQMLNWAAFVYVLHFPSLYLYQSNHLHLKFSQKIKSNDLQKMHF